MICKNCGTEFHNNYCPKCGMPLSVDTLVKKPKSNKKQYIMRMFVFLVIIITGLFIIGVITLRSYDDLGKHVSITKYSDDECDSEIKDEILEEDVADDKPTEITNGESTEDPKVQSNIVNGTKTTNHVLKDSEVQADDLIYDETGRAAAYSEVITSLQERYGVGYYEEDGKPIGLVVVREIDFDKDGIAELLCSFFNAASERTTWTFESPYCDETSCMLCYEVWGWQNSQAVRLVHAPLLSFISVDENELILVDRDDGVYLLQGCGNLYFGVSIVATVQNGQWTEVEHIYSCVDEGFDFNSPDNYNSEIPMVYYNFGKQITEDESDAIHAKYYPADDFSHRQIIPVWYGGNQFSQTMKTIQYLNDGMVASSATISPNRS